MYVNDHFSSKYESIIEYSDIVDKNIVMCMYDETALYWVHHLASDKVFACATNEWLIYYSKKFDVYFFYYLLFDGFNQTIFAKALNEVASKNKSTHFILAYDSGRIINYFEQFKIEKFNYSLLNFNSEILMEKGGSKDIYECKNLKYFFSCTNMLRKDSNGKEVAGTWEKENSDKFILDYKYAFTCFYIKLGFNYFQIGEQGFEVSNRQNKVFLYSKSPNSDLSHPRYNAIVKALETGKILNKSYTNDDWFWYFANYNYYHTPFVSDYNLCKLNLVMETQSINEFDTEESQLSRNQFFSEKTLKALMVSTPAYVLLQYKVYKELKDYGFYFLNEEFGEYDYGNYKRFCEFLTSATDVDIDKLFKMSYEYSKHNKNKVEEYIYSDKVKELNLLIG